MAKGFTHAYSNSILAQIWHKIKKPTLISELNLLFLFVRPEGFEPVAYGLEVRCSSPKRGNFDIKLFGEENSSAILVPFLV
ncbi:MAG: hypothetical protein O6943_10915, partial [Bacteroidetes bacterium]|nr:hypothetical protein [Bacteroidota bacterium]